MTAALPNDRWNIQFSANQVDPNFNPAVGFVTRRGYRRYQPFVEFGPRPRGHRYIRRYLFSTAADVQNDMHNDLLNRSVELKFFEMQFHSQDSFAFTATTGRERLDTPFSPAPGIVLPVGSVYDTAVLNIRGQTANRRVISLNVLLRNRRLLLGHEEDGIDEPDPPRAPRVHRLHDGRVEQREVARGGLHYPAHSRRRRDAVQSVDRLVNNLQYDSVSAVLGWQSRFRWILRPGSDIYFVYTHNWLDDVLQNKLVTLDNRIAAKVLYTHRF